MNTTITTEIEQIKHQTANAAYTALRTEQQLSGSDMWTDNAGMIIAAVRKYGTQKGKAVAMSATFAQDATDTMKWVIAHEFVGMNDQDFSAFVAWMNEPVDMLLRELELITNIDIDEDEQDEEYFEKMYMTHVNEFYVSAFGARNEGDVEVLNRRELLAIGNGYWNNEQREMAARIIRNKGIEIAA